MENRIAEFSVKKKVQEPGEERRKFFVLCMELMETSKRFSAHVLQGRLAGIEDPEKLVYHALARFSLSLRPLIPDALLKSAIENLRQYPESFILSICWGARDFKLEVGDVVEQLRKLTAAATSTLTREFQEEFDPERMRTWLAEGPTSSSAALNIAAQYGKLEPLRHSQLALAYRNHPMSALTKADPDATADEKELAAMKTTVEQKADVLNALPLIQQRRFCWGARSYSPLADVLASSEFQD